MAEIALKAAAHVARVLQDDAAVRVADLGRQFCRIVRSCCDVAASTDPGAVVAFDTWLSEARGCGERVVENLAASLDQDGTAV